MLNQLRKKFIHICMLCLLAVFMLLILSINGISAYRVTHELDHTLTVIHQANGRLKTLPAQNGPVTAARQQPFPPEFLFKTRYFSVFFDSGQQVTDTYLEAISAVDREQAQTMAAAALARGRSSGWLNGGYRYRLWQDASGGAVIFLDAGSELSGIYSLLLISSLVMLASYTLIFLLLLLFSRRAMRPFAESYSKQRQFITDAGHELKTPLTIIATNTEIMKLNHGDNQWLASTQKQLNRMGRLIAHLIQLSRMDEGSAAPQRQQFSLSEAVSDSVMSFSALAEQSGKRLLSEIAPGIAYQGDEAALLQLISILLDNAVKYCDPGGTIRVRLLRQRKSVLLTVSNDFRDTGSLPLSRLFDRFYRADPARSGNGSYGLGLSIAKSIVESHHGSIQALAEEQGLRMEVCLP